jgi:Zn-dependent M28 family amino/carboxypeptidase
LAVEDYNRLARMIKGGETLKIAIDLHVEFQDDDPMAYNTIAEIPGTDPVLKDEIVMVGAHLDSWHSGTGATDNGVGSAAAMEAVRIIRALDLKPRRTIRVALWTGEEQGLFGSAAYVKKHFGHDPDPRNRFRRAEVADPASGGDAAPASAEQPTTRPVRRIIKEADYEKLSVYFNLDNGTGKIRGIYAQGNEDAVPIFREWLAYFGDLGANTVTISNTGGTDHGSFDQINLPGFQFIQDPIEYNSRTHHSNYDVYDRIQADDVKQASTIMAAFVWKAAQMDERFPRKPLPTSERR